jgi:hypothetical protein
MSLGLLDSVLVILSVLISVCVVSLFGHCTGLELESKIFTKKRKTLKMKLE